jgi:ribosomal protein S18 acetylase RimI-like enzyme
MRIIFIPEEKYMLQIKTWLYSEMLNRKSYFYYNFISSDIRDGNFVCCLNDNDEAIGYMQFTYSEKYTNIDVAVVQYEHQGKGIGKMLLDAMTELVRQKGSVVLSLMCAPKSSATKWKKLGFKKFKEVDNHYVLRENQDEHPWLYKVIVTDKTITRKKILENYIELWTQFEYKVYSSKLVSNYRWDVTTLNSPIIYPVDGEWKVKYVKQGIVVYEGVIKRFKQNCCTYGNFLVVESLR